LSRPWGHGPRALLARRWALGPGAPGVRSRLAGLAVPGTPRRRKLLGLGQLQRLTTFRLRAHRARGGWARVHSASLAARQTPSPEPSPRGRGGWLFLAECVRGGGVSWPSVRDSGVCRVGHKSLCRRALRRWPCALQMAKPIGGEIGNLSPVRGATGWGRFGGCRIRGGRGPRSGWGDRWRLRASRPRGGRRLRTSFRRHRRSGRR